MKKKVTPEMAAEFKRLQGTMLVREIAAMFGVSENTVYCHINKKFLEKTRQTQLKYRAKRREDPEKREKDRQYWLSKTKERRQNAKNTSRSDSADAVN